MKHTGKVWWFGEHIDTDVIIPARYLTSNDAKELAQHCMETADPDFAKNVQEGDFIVAGPLFGMGSSREHAPLAIKGCGVTAVIAPSFARIFQRNSINVGMPVLECDTLWEDVQQGDVIEVDMDEGTILHQRTGKTHKASQYPEFLKEIIAAGGLVPYTRKKIEAKA